MAIPIVWLTEGSQHTIEMHSVTEVQPRWQEEQELVKQKWQKRSPEKEKSMYKGQRKE